MPGTSLTLATSRQFLESRKSYFAQALANRIDPDAFIRVAHAAITKQPALLECTPASLLMALSEAASLGLMPNGVLGHAYIIPYRNKGTMEAQFQPGYRGLIDLARRSGHVLRIVPRSVYSNDHFRVTLGIEENIEHVPQMDDRGELRFVYAVAHLTDGSAQFEIMSIAEVQAIRKRSRAGTSGPWVTDFEAMAWKTVIKRLIKFLPLSLDADEAVHKDNMVEVGEGDAATISSAPERERTTRTDQLKSQLRGPVQDAEVVEDDSEDEPDLTPIFGAEGEGEALLVNQLKQPVSDLLYALDELEPAGGDATSSQRSRLQAQADLIYGAGTEEAIQMREVAKDPELGKGQAEYLLGLAKQAMEYKPEQPELV